MAYEASAANSSQTALTESPRAMASTPQAIAPTTATAPQITMDRVSGRRDRWSWVVVLIGASRLEHRCAPPVGHARQGCFPPERHPTRQFQLTRPGSRG